MTAPFSFCCVIITTQRAMPSSMNGPGITPAGFCSWSGCTLSFVCEQPNGKTEMVLNRRQFTLLSVAGAMARIEPVRAADRAKYKAIAFDGFPIIDARPVFARVEQVFPGKGAELSAAWRVRQFEYGWLRT